MTTRKLAICIAVAVYEALVLALALHAVHANARGYALLVLGVGAAGFFWTRRGFRS